MPITFPHVSVDASDGEVKPSGVLEVAAGTARDAVKGLMYMINSTGKDNAYLNASIAGGKAILVKLPVAVTGITVYEEKDDDGCKRFYAMAAVSSIDFRNNK